MGKWYNENNKKVVSTYSFPSNNYKKKKTYEGDEYEGTWRDSKAEGRGVYVWKNGDRYDGEWKDNRKWGRGKKTFSTGDEYNGEWKVR